MRIETTMDSGNSILLELSKEDLGFLTWALEFLEGGPFGAETERKRGEMVYKVRKAQEDFEKGAIHIASEFFWNLLHPTISQVSKSRFVSGHYADSVEAALKEVNKIIKDIVKDETGEELDGASLMHRAFSPNQPIICIGDLSTETGRNIQQGYMQIYAGAMIGIRNPKAHENINIDSTRAIYFLTLASLLMSKLDERR